MYTHKNGLTLRKMAKSDLEDLKALKDESWFGTHNITIINMEEQNKWYDSMIGNPRHMVMIVEDNRDESEPVGPVGVYKVSNIDWQNGRYDSAHDVFKQHRGKGYGKPLLEAGVDFGFEVLNTHRIDTEVLENNIASQKCALFVGFQEEGLKRKCVHKCDQWLDSIFYGLLREDWRQLERVRAMDGVCNTSYQPKDGSNKPD
jgi:RimJ/RimL family protein N-acetyltransferase